MRKGHLVFGLVDTGALALAATLAACGGATDRDDQGRGVESQGSSRDPRDVDTATDADSRATPRYEVVIIDDANFTHEPNAINNRGQIAGSARNDEDVRAAWFWDGAQGHFIMGDRPDGAGVATDVNDAGQVVGTTLFFRDYSEMPGMFAFRGRAFVYDGTLRDLPVLGGNSQGRAEGINRRGDVVGTSFGGTGDQHAVLYTDGQIVNLGLGQAFAINNRGDVVASIYVGDVRHAFLYSGGQLRDLGTLGGETSSAVDINAAGEIVGSSSTSDGRTRAFLYRNGAMFELPVPGDTSAANAINRGGAVVGTYSSLSTPVVLDGFLYEKGQVFSLSEIALPAGCWQRLEARDINDRGDIVAIGIASAGASCGIEGRYLVVLTEHPQRYEPK